MSLRVRTTAVAFDICILSQSYLCTMRIFVKRLRIMMFYRLRKDIHLDTKGFCKRVHNSSFRGYREPSGLDVDLVVPELMRVKNVLSECIVKYEQLSSTDVIDNLKEANIRGLYAVFPYGTRNTDFIIKKAYESGDLHEHLCYCYNRICEYEEYLRAA